MRRCIDCGCATCGVRVSRLEAAVVALGEAVASLEGFEVGGSVEVTKESRFRVLRAIDPLPSTGEP